MKTLKIVLKKIKNKSVSISNHAHRLFGEELNKPVHFSNEEVENKHGPFEKALSLIDQNDFQSSIAVLMKLKNQLKEEKNLDPVSYFKVISEFAH